MDPGTLDGFGVAEGAPDDVRLVGSTCEVRLTWLSAIEELDFVFFVFLLVVARGEREMNDAVAREEEAAGVEVGAAALLPERVQTRGHQM